jgi:vacuolar-type H+-ATPase subunit E/Vma4
VTLDAARDALLADARERAAARLAEADAEAGERIERARREAGELVARARAQGEAEGRVAAARAAAVERSSARMEVLAVQRAASDELRRRARAAVLALREAPDYRELLERLTAAARRDLGDGAEIECDPPDVGGVRARAGTRLVDYTLVVLADRCVDALGSRLPRLWA